MLLPIGSMLGGTMNMVQSSCHNLSNNLNIFFNVPEKLYVWEYEYFKTVMLLYYIHPFSDQWEVF